jgi:subtilisin family serine protease
MHTEQNMRAPKNEQQRRLRQSRLETFEPRHMMTANPVAEIDIPAPEMMIEQVEVAAAQTSGTNDTGVDYIHQNYGFDGSGQTIAVIDSGIAWDHYALGGGFGKDYRVVGGWDFAENDANPYDDAPVGFHGSHVAGVIGSSDANHPGVASAADLVALRVFDDYGNGDFKWVEQALQWVHKHRNDFENPITTVNLSLGTNWNANTVPEWSMLEDEFAQLEKDGIFISVAAGNSFKSFGEKGLSYPAASKHVVPVGSYGADGKISDFSQRNERILVAPGENIMSTVPEHVVGKKGAAQSWYSASGTSMSAPYVAGASALLRQAMEFMGEKNITQDTLYDHFRQTADRVYDSLTKTNYFHLNLGRAIDSVIGDDYGNSINAAYDLGKLNGNSSITGTIGQKTDVDYFTFDATSNGKVSFTVTATHDLQAQMGLVGGKLTRSGDTFTLDVEAGKAYTLFMTTGKGIGHYTLDVKAAQTFNVAAKDWGTIAQKSITGINVQGETWHQFTASRDGMITLQLQDANANANLQFEVYDSRLRLIDTNTSGNSARIDFVGQQGESYFVRFQGKAANVEMQVTNLINLQGKSLKLNGTNAADDIQVNLQDQISVSINGAEYQFDKIAVNRVTVDAGRGADQFRLIGSNQAETALVQGDRIAFNSNALKILAVNIETTILDGGGGADRVRIKGTADSDALVARTGFARISSSAYSTTLENFESVFAVSTGTGDTATLFDSKGRDRLVAKGDVVRQRSNEQFYAIRGFDSVSAFSSGGNDKAFLFDTVGNDVFVGQASSASIRGDGYATEVNGFSKVSAISRKGGLDTADLYGNNNDLIVTKSQRATVIGQTVTNQARGFHWVNVHAVGDSNLGRFILSDSASQLNVNRDVISFKSGQGTIQVNGLNQANVQGGGGLDEVIFSEIGQLDEVLGIGNLAQVNYRDLQVKVKDVELITAHAKAGETARAELNAIEFLFSSEGDWE